MFHIYLKYLYLLLMFCVYWYAEADSRREMERINQEKKNRQNLEFVSGGRQSTIVGTAPKLNIPVPG